MFDAINDDKQLLLILGGARAGKSSCALRLAAERERLSGSNVCFIATAQALDEMQSGDKRSLMLGNSPPFVWYRAVAPPIPTFPHKGGRSASSALA